MDRRQVTVRHLGASANPHGVMIIYFLCGSYETEGKMRGTMAVLIVAFTLFALSFSNIAWAVAMHCDAYGKANHCHAHYDKRSHSCVC